jgi:Cu/Ag efflux pump CusA
MNFVKASLKNRQVTLTVFLLMFAFGIYSLITMPRREDPKITIPAGLVVAYFPGADITQVEDQVTSKIEEYLFSSRRSEKTRHILLPLKDLPRYMYGSGIMLGNLISSGASSVIN